MFPHRGLYLLHQPDLPRPGHEVGDGALVGRADAARAAAAVDIVSRVEGEVVVYYMLDLEASRLLENEFYAIAHRKPMKEIG